MYIPGISKNFSLCQMNVTLLIYQRLLGMLKTASNNIISSIQKPKHRSLFILEIFLTHNHADGRGDSVSTGNPCLPEAALKGQHKYPKAS